MPLITARRQFVQRVLSQYAVNDNGCWIWQGADNSKRGGRPFGIYGVCTIRFNRLACRILAHRLSFAFHTGNDPDRLSVCHRCDVPLCINPEHLFLGTAQQNMADAQRKGRLANQSGSKNGNAKLTELEVCAIAALLSGLNNKQIAEVLGDKVTHSTVSLIRLGRKWQHITGIEETRPRKRPAA